MQKISFYTVEGLTITIELLELNYTCPTGTESNDSLIFSEKYFILIPNVRTSPQSYRRKYIPPPFL